MLMATYFVVNTFRKPIKICKTSISVIHKNITITNDEFFVFWFLDRHAYVARLNITGSFHNISNDLQKVHRKYYFE